MRNDCLDWLPRRSLSLPMPGAASDVRRDPKPKSLSGRELLRRWRSYASGPGLSPRSPASSSPPAPTPTSAA